MNTNGEFSPQGCRLKHGLASNDGPPSSDSSQGSNPDANLVPISTSASNTITGPNNISLHYQGLVHEHICACAMKNHPLNVPFFSLYSTNRTFSALKSKRAPIRYQKDQHSTSQSEKISIIQDTLMLTKKSKQDSCEKPLNSDLARNGSHLLRSEQRPHIISPGHIEEFIHMQV